jgi:hypothetical protein
MVIEEQSVTFVTSKIVVFPLSRVFGLFSRHELRSLMIAHFLQIICIPLLIIGVRVEFLAMSHSRGSGACKTIV